MRYFLIIATLFLCCLSAHAQTYPVQVNTQIVPPYSPYLTDYTIPGAQKLMVNILLKDLTLPEYPSKLRLTIEGVGITIRTKPTYAPPPLMLPGGGIPLLLYGEDIAEYFDPANLDFAGITRSQYQKGAKLPEGVYRFTIEVLDYNRGTPVSNKGTSVAWIILNDPPLLNFPKREAKVQFLDPTNIAFSWTPRHTASPNSAFSTEYIFKLVEIWPANRNPFDAMLTMPPLYEITTNFSQIIYGPAEPALIAGRKYAWQVQARDEEGRDLFKNQGKSEVFVFQFGDALGIPENLRLQTATPSALTVRWDQPVAGTEAITYRIRYRPAGDQSGPWYEDTSDELWRTITSLQPDKDYQVQIRAEQAIQLTEYSAPQIFRTKVAGSNDFSCSSDIQPPPQPGSTQPLFKLGINDTIRAGGYDVVVRKVSGSNGTYTGEGVAIVPWFMSAKVRVTFDKIGVNEQYWLTSGTIKSVWDANSKFLLKPETKPGKQVTPEMGDLDGTFVETETLIHITSGLVVSVTKNEDGDIVVETSSGETKVVPKGTSASIYDDAGNGYIVDKEGNIGKTTAEAALAAYEKGQRDYNMQLSFAPGTGKFGFDEKKFDVLASYYQKLDDTDSYIPWKAISSSKTDVVDAILEGTGIDSKKIKFAVNGEDVFPQQASDNKFTLSLLGKTNDTKEELIASYQESDTSALQVIGKLNLTSYDKITKKVVIVPVNMDMPGDINVSSVTTSLGAIYEQAVAYWEVGIANRVNVSFDQAFDDGGSGLFSNYTADMKKVIGAYGQLQDETYYIFLIENTTSSGTSALGYMPRSKQAGFVFYGNHMINPATKSTAAVLRTMAHELGHGVFNLKHTFKEFPGLSTNGDNLMDYPAGAKLYKYQWDYVHDPQRVIPLFEDDEDSELAGETWFTPDWRPFTIGDISNTIYASQEVTVPQGTIPGIVVAGKKYEAKFNEDKTFAGYFGEGIDDPLNITYRDIGSTKIKDSDRVYLFQRNECSTSRYYHTTFKYANEHRAAIVYGDIKNVTDHGLVKCNSSILQDDNNTEIIININSEDVSAALERINKQLAKPSKNEFTGEEISLKQVLFITYVSDTASHVQEFKNYNVGSEKIIFWITYDPATKAVALKSVRFPQVKQSELQQALTRIWNDIKAEPFHLQWILLYEFSDLLSKGLEYLIIPPHIYDCSDPKYNKLYPKIFGYLNIVNVATRVVPFQSILIFCTSEELKKINENLEQFEFAFYCGIWNGLVGVVKSVPDLVNFAASPFSPTGRDKIVSQAKAFAEMQIDGVCMADQYGCKVWELTKSAAKDAFKNGCVGSHTVGSIVGPIIVACLGDVAALTGELGVVSSTIRTTLRFFKWCDEAGDIMTYFSKFGKAAIKLMKGPGGELLAHLEVDGIPLVRQEGENFIVKQVRNGEVIDVTVSKEGLGGISKESFDEVLKKLGKGGEVVGTYDWNLVRRYFQHIQEVTGRPVGQKQIDRLKEALRAKEYNLLSEGDIAIHRAEFNSRKNQIIKDWERETGQEWPKYTESVYSKNGVEIRKPGDLYDAHHIIENKFGGDNEWWNMHPAKFPDEHQGGIHGAGSPSRELFK